MGKGMKTTSCALILGVLLTGTAGAYLNEGNSAPDFTLPTVNAGHTNSFTLSDALKHGPVVLYFFPPEVDLSCSAESQHLELANSEFSEFFTTVVSVSTNELDSLEQASQGCTEKFTVAADPDRTVMQAYDASFDSDYSANTRIAYVISPSGDIIHVHQSGEPLAYIYDSVAAVQQWTVENDAENY